MRDRFPALRSRPHLTLSVSGVAVIVILISQSIGAPAQKTAGTTPHQPSGTPPIAQWNTSYREDPMTTEKHLEANLSVPADYGGRSGEAQVTATCNDNPMDRSEPFLSFKIVYLSKFDKALGFVYTQPDPIVTGGPYVAQVNSQSHYVTFRVRVDDKLETVKSGYYHPNVLMLTFRGQGIPDSAGAVAAGYGAKLIRVELPLANGDSPVVDMKPQDPSFREFAARCLGSNVHVGPSDTVAEFEAMLPDVLSKAAIAHGLGSHGYDKELDFIRRTLDNCVQTPIPHAACGWYSYQTLFMGTFIDVSILASDSHGSPGNAKSLAIGDLLLSNSDTGKIGNTGRSGQVWEPGEAYDISLKIATGFPAGGWNFDDVFTGIQVRGTSAAPSSR